MHEGGEKEYHEVRPQRVKLAEIPGSGRILDIGGGGEGVIGQLEGGRVVAIDKNRGELEETENEALKIVMDACEMKFLDSSFPTATAFFCMMYIPSNKWGSVFAEVARVLEPKGDFLIWDWVIEPGSARGEEIWVIPLTISMSDGNVIETGYGCRVHRQDQEDFISLGVQHGFEILESERQDMVFLLHLRKI